MSIEYQKGYNEVESTDIKLGDLDNDYVRKRAEEFMEEGYSEEEAIEKAREADNNSIEEDVILEYISDEIYDSPESTIREYIANAETATLRAVENHGLEHPQIDITYNKSEGQLVIQDNGIGISTDKMSEVCGVVGRTDVLNSNNMSGMFGMGMYSVFQIIGTNSRAEIVTHSRRTDENYGILFGLRDKTYTNYTLDEDVYGTRVSMVLDEEKERDLDIQDTVEKYSKWCRVPVSYREINENKEEVCNEEYGGRNIDDNLSDSKMMLDIDTDLYRAVAHPDCNCDTLLVSMEIKRNDYNRSYNSPFSFSVRIKEEGGPIVNGWAKGKIPMKENEYEDIDEKYRDRYVKKKWVDPEEAFFGYDYVCLPTPTGDRDRFKSDESKAFMSWLGDQINQKYKKKIRNLFKDIETIEDLKDLSSSEMVTLRRARKEKPSNKTLTEYYDLDLTEKAMNYLDMLNEKVSLARRQNSANGVCRKKNRTDSSIESVIGRTGKEGDVYMGIRLTPRRVEAAWDIHEKNQVVQVSSYDKYEENLGWKKLKDIDLENKSTKYSKSVSRRDKEIDEKIVNLSINSRMKGRSKETVGDIIEHLKGEDEFTGTLSDVKYFIPFYTSHDENITENYHLAGKIPNEEGKVAIANTTNEIYEYIKDFEGVLEKEEYIDMISTYEVETMNGEIDLVDRILSTDETTDIIGLNDRVINLLTEEGLKERYVEYINEKKEDPVVVLGNTSVIDNIEDIEETELESDDYTRGKSWGKEFVVEEIWYPDWDESFDDIRFFGSRIYLKSRSVSVVYKIMKVIHDNGFDYGCWPESIENPFENLLVELEDNTTLELNVRESDVNRQVRRNELFVDGEEMSHKRYLVEKVWFPDWEVTLEDIKDVGLGSVAIENTDREHRMLKFLHDKGVDFEELSEVELRKLEPKD